MTKIITLQFEVTDNVDEDLFLEAITQIVHDDNSMDEDQKADLKGAVADVTSFQEIGHEEWDEYYQESWDFLVKSEDADLGTLFREYIEESAHSGWEGYPQHELLGVFNMIVDMVTYAKNRTKAEITADDIDPYNCRAPNQHG